MSPRATHKRPILYNHQYITTTSMDVDTPAAGPSSAANSSTAPAQSPAAYIEQHEARAQGDAKAWWTRLRTAHERKCVERGVWLRPGARGRVLMAEHERRLWHNITLLLEEYVARDKPDTPLAELFDV